MLKNKIIAESITMQFQVYYKAIVIKTAWYWQKKKQTHWSTESKWIPRHESTHIWTSEFWERTEIYTLEKTVSSTNSTDRAGWMLVEECKWILPYHPWQNSSSDKTLT